MKHTKSSVRKREGRRAVKARKLTGRWRKIRGHRFSWRDFPAVAGSWERQTNGNVDYFYWDMSSVFENKGWDAHRTHFLALPKPPRRPQVSP